MTKLRENMAKYTFACCFIRGETWSSTLREGRRLRMLDKTALRETFGTKSDEETEGRRGLNKHELHNLTPQQIFRVIK